MNKINHTEVNEKITNIATYVGFLLERNTQAGMIEAMIASQMPYFKNDVDTHYELLIKSIRDNRHRDAVAIALALIKVDGAKTIRRLRRSGQLRSSRYLYKVNCLGKVVDALLVASKSLSLPEQQIIYLESILSLYAIVPKVQEMHRRIMMRLKSRKKVILKTLLVFIDRVFSNINANNNGENAIYSPTPEQFADAYSWLFEAFRSEHGIARENWVAVDEVALGHNPIFYREILNGALRIKDFLQAETMIDALPYQAHLKDRAVVVSSIDPELEKSVRLGYIQVEQQMKVRAIDIVKSQQAGGDLPSFEKIVKVLFESGLDHYVQLRKEPYERLVFKIPDNPAFFKIFSDGGPYLEDVMALSLLDLEDYGQSKENVPKINDKIDWYDVLKVQRLFAFFNEIFSQKLNSIKDELTRRRLTLHSVLPCFSHSDFKMILQKIIDDPKAEEMIKLLRLDDSIRFVDIQCTPLVDIGGGYCLSPALISKSNLIRNITYAKNLQPSYSKGTDPMHQAVVDALKLAGFNVHTEFNADLNGKRESDILAARDGILFIFECKNSYHPCSSHEMRSSFDLIETAREQLDVRINVLRDPEKLQKLFKHIGWVGFEVSEIYTGIIIANRVFHGYQYGCHPVRQAHELINVISRGYVERCADGKRLRFWENENFHASDLIAYLQGKSIISDQQRSLQSMRSKTRFGDMTLEFETYFSDAKLASKVLEEKYGSNEANV